MSAKKKYRDTARAKGAAIARSNSSDYAANVRKLKKRNILLKFVIVAVALFESVLLVVFSSFSWIENTSSLRIQGLDLPISSNRYYQMNAGTGDSRSVDLHEYFDEINHFRFAKTTSPDGKKFYFPKFSTSAVTASNSNHRVGNSNDYREGDTTDYNTSYYYFDIRLNNEGSNQKYYFEEGRQMFTVTGTDDSDVIAAAQNCYRLSVTQGSQTFIFANGSTARNNYSVTTSNGSIVESSQKTTDLISAHSYHLVDGRIDSNMTEVCSVDSGDESDIEFRIWFEVNDPAYIALTPTQKEKLDRTQVKVDFKLINASSDVRSFYFHDYSLSTSEAVDRFDSGYGDFTGGDRLYFAYYKTVDDEGNTLTANNRETVYIPMVPTTAGDSDHIVWRTAYDNGSTIKGMDVITLIMRNDLQTSTSYSSSYFFYGTPSNKKKVWYLDGAPTTTTGTAGADGFYNYLGFGVTDNAGYDNGSTSGSTGCYGMWHGSGTTNDPVPIYFSDQMCYNSTNDYNIDAYQPLGETNLYISTQGSVSAANSNKTLRMHYDSNLGLYKGYLPSSASGTFYIYDIESGYNSSYDIRFGSLSRGTVSGGEDDLRYPIYSAFGYNGTTGYGVWGSSLDDGLARVNLSAELIDTYADTADRYKITYTYSGTNYSYDMAGEDALTMYAYVPSAYYNQNNSSFGFTKSYYDYAEDQTVTATWSASQNGSSSTFYPVDLTGTGYWRVAVLVDGTRDNLLNTILTENGAANGPAWLGYSTNSAINDSSADNLFSAMQQLDHYRWYMPANLADNVDYVSYRFVAYLESQNVAGEPGYVDTRFTIYHDVSGDGSIFYYTVTEAIE